MKSILLTLASAVFFTLNAAMLGATLWLNFQFEDYLLDMEINRLKQSCSRKYPIATLEDTNEGLKITWKEGE
jgi:hypothetical protein